MACSCKGRKDKKFLWYNGEDTTLYDKEIQAKAKVIRKGGTYISVDPTLPIAPQLTAAQG